MDYSTAPALLFLFNILLLLQNIRKVSIDFFIIICIFI